MCSYKFSQLLKYHHQFLRISHKLKRYFFRGKEFFVLLTGNIKFAVMLVAPRRTANCDYVDPTVANLH